MRKFLLSFAIIGAITALFSADLVEINTLNAKKQSINIKVPLKPKRVAVIDLAALDTIDALGFGKNVVAMPKAQKIDYLSRYTNDKNIINIGTAKEINMEKLMSAQPDIIFIGGRLQPKFDELSRIAPVVFLEINYEKGSFESIKNNISTIAKIFDADEKAKEKILEYEARLNKIKELANGKNAIIGLVTSSSFHTLGNSKRCSLITTDGGFTNLANDISSTHGNESSFELLVKLNPQYLFVLDRDSAISKPGAKVAQEVMDNELVRKTKAFNNGKIFYLSPTPWYLSEGGIRATDIMLSDIEKALK
ncbi:ABC transporter substrate-binding protein [Campylobacter sp. RM12920]|uniref:ABC transporter substrate-binding protein n=1 Tax=Campylobacter californiensis TaxID=1032243 RepID=A0ABD4JJM1_9BACT|nr:ABC transporter substrate-binding protein [Campylobacter sp. RM12919]MBE2988602.1 ABC transporter substrate-binding protein [Campylobacter sp. RM12920]